MDLKLHSRQHCNQSGLILHYYFFVFCLFGCLFVFLIMLSLVGFLIFSGCRHEVGLFIEPACLLSILETRLGEKKEVEGQTKGKKIKCIILAHSTMLYTAAQNIFLNSWEGHHINLHSFPVFCSVLWVFSILHVHWITACLSWTLFSLMYQLFGIQC